MTPCVSIIMGIYNCEKTLSEAIDSILEQSFKDWELIMCDDGSTDRTTLIAKQYADAYPDKVILISNEKNMGLNYTLNKCIKIAKGKYIARMDGDDISLPDRLEKEVVFLDSYPEYAIVSTLICYFDEKGVWGKCSMPKEPQKEYLVKSTPHCHAPCMVRKEAYDAVDGYSVDKRLLRMEDYDLWTKMYAKGYRGYNLQEPLYMMRDDRNATARRKYRYRINEAYVRAKAIRELNLGIFNYAYLLRPLVVGLLPTKLYEYLHRLRLAKVDRKRL